MHIHILIHLHAMNTSSMNLFPKLLFKNSLLLQLEKREANRYQSVLIISHATIPALLVTKCYVIHWCRCWKETEANASMLFPLPKPQLHSLFPHGHGSMSQTWRQSKASKLWCQGSIASKQSILKYHSVNKSSPRFHISPWRLPRPTPSHCTDTKSTNRGSWLQALTA